MPKAKQEDSIEPEVEEDPRERKLDSFIIKIFPAFVVVFGFIAVLIYIFEWDNHSLGHFLYALGIAYAAGFALLGVPSMYYSRRRRVKMRYSVPAAAAAIFVGGSLLWLIFGDDEESVNDFVANFSFVVGMDPEDISYASVVVGCFVLFAIIVLATYGILAVVTAYFRRNYHRILLSLMKPGESKLKSRSLSLFAVPDIIDVTDVTINPEPDTKDSDRKVFRRVFGNIVGVGLIIASYLFLNPVFLDTIDFTDMMMTMVLISLFIVVLVVPVSILRSLDAEALSAAPRPFIIWKGMKSKMFKWWMFILLMLTLLWICLYYPDVDTERIFFSYLGYTVFIICMGAVSAYIYSNTFYCGLRDGIADRFRLLHARRQR
ncbi:MAG: hypothetical protein ACOX8X_01155 [Methanomethylophilus sp.]|jgi:hypothetical protein